MRRITATFVLSLGVVVAGCQSPVSPASEAHVATSTGGQNAEGVGTQVTGGGRFPHPSGIDFDFSFSARLMPDGGAQGTFHHRGVAGSDLIQFSAVITCLGIDPVNHRAWLGGVVTENRSTHPGFTTPIHQVGRDIWFRVQDNDAVEPSTTPDVTTIVGFESAAIPTSEFYCTTKPWRSDNVWPVVGNVLVKP